jgi:hypothetical protein
MAGVKRTAFQKLQKARRDNCASKITVTELKAVSKAYVTDAVAKGKPKTEAEAIAKRVTDTACDVIIAGQKAKRRSAAPRAKAAAPKRKTTRRRA